jgi:hypothetical protein
MIERKQNPFDTPVAGQSLTDEPKNYSWENPPRFTKAEDASIFIWKKLHKKNTAAKIILLLETGVSVESITKVIIFSGFMEGSFTPDVGFLLTPIVEKMVLAMGKAADIKEIKLTKAKVNETEKVMEELFKSRNVKEDMESLKKEDSLPKEEIEKETQGLMSKGEE